MTAHLYIQTCENNLPSVNEGNPRSSAWGYGQIVYNCLKVQQIKFLSLFPKLGKLANHNYNTYIWAHHDYTQHAYIEDEDLP